VARLDAFCYIREHERQWRSQDLHMEGVGRATGTAGGAKGAGGRAGGGSGRGLTPSRKGVRGITPEKILEIYLL
jgi:hypothetical protein